MDSFINIKNMQNQIFMEDIVMVKIKGIVGSPRTDGNTSFLVETALKSAEEAGAETEIINLGSARYRTLCGL